MLSKLQDGILYSESTIRFDNYVIDKIKFLMNHKIVIYFNKNKINKPLENLFDKFNI